MVVCTLVYRCQRVHLHKRLSERFRVGKCNLLSQKLKRALEFADSRMVARNLGLLRPLSKWVPLGFPFSRGPLSSIFPFAYILFLILSNKVFLVEIELISPSSVTLQFYLCILILAAGSA